MITLAKQLVKMRYLKQSSIFAIRAVVLGCALALALNSCDGPKKNQSADQPFPSTREQSAPPSGTTGGIPAPDTTALRDDVDVTALISDPLAADKSLPVPLLAVGKLDAGELNRVRCSISTKSIAVALSTEWGQVTHFNKLLARIIDCEWGQVTHFNSPQRVLIVRDRSFSSGGFPAWL